MDSRFSWDDVEKFREIARGLEEDETFEELSGRLGLESPRMIKARLDRLEKALRLPDHGLVERRKYDPGARLSGDGVALLRYAERLADLRDEIDQSFAGHHVPTLRVATNLPTLMILAPDLIMALGERRAEAGHASRLGFRPEILVIDDYGEVLRRVAAGGVDVALFGRTPLDRGVPLPRHVRLEVLLSSAISVFVPQDHALARKRPDGLQLRDLDREHIIARPFFRFLFDEAEPTGGWTPVTDFGEVHAYIRSGVGIGLNTHFGFHMLSEVERKARAPQVGDIVELPFREPKMIDICLIRASQKKRWRHIGPEAEAYLDALRAFYDHKKARLDHAAVSRAHP